MRRLRYFLPAALLYAACANAQPGIWIEIGDAPEGVPDRQLTVGMGELAGIRGSLDRANGDHVDTFGIVIDDPTLFYASTSSHLGGSLPQPRELLINTRMWLWSTSTANEMAANLQLANDDDAFMPLDLASTISDPNTFTMLTTGMIDPTAASIDLVAGGTYLLSISSFDNNPRDGEGTNLAEIDPARLTDLYGPNPVAGPFSQWDNGPSADAGEYVIALQGVRFGNVPEPATAPLGTLCCLLACVLRRGDP